VDDITDKLYNIKRLKLTFGGNAGNASSTDIMNMSLALALNLLPQCSVSVSSASPSVPKINDYCKIILSTDKGDHLLFNGYIAEISQSTATHTTHVQSYYTYRVAIFTESLDSTPPAAWTYLTNAVDTENSIIHGYTVVGNNITNGVRKAQQSQALSTDIPGMILKTIDKLQDEISSGGAGTPVSRYFTWDPLALNMKGSHEVLRYITTRAAALIKNGQSYMQAISALCNEFFLTIIPKKVGSWYKMHITRAPAWGTVSKYISLAGYSALLTRQESVRNRQIDGIVMPYWDTTGQKQTNMGQYIFYGRKANSSGLSFEIFDHKSMSKYFGSTTGYLKYKQIPLPTWLSKGLAVSDLQAAIRRILKEYFASYMYANRGVQVTLPYPVYKWVSTHLGEIIGIAVPGNMAKGLDDINSTSKDYIIGQLSSVTIDMNFVQDRFIINCGASLTHARPISTDKVLNFKAKDLLYV
jgi:hypothetical protein